MGAVFEAAEIHVDRPCPAVPERLRLQHFEGAAGFVRERDLRIAAPGGLHLQAELRLAHAPRGRGGGTAAEGDLPEFERRLRPERPRVAGGVPELVLRRDFDPREFVLREHVGRGPALVRALAGSYGETLRGHHHFFRRNPCGVGDLDGDRRVLADLGLRLRRQGHPVREADDDFRPGRIDGHGPSQHRQRRPVDLERDLAVVGGVEVGDEMVRLGTERHGAPEGPELERRRFGEEALHDVAADPELLVVEADDAVFGNGNLVHPDRLDGMEARRAQLEDEGGIGLVLARVRGHRRDVPERAGGDREQVRRQLEGLGRLRRGLEALRRKFLAVDGQHEP